MAAIELDQCPSTYRPYVPQPDIIAERQIRHVEECERICTFMVALRVPLVLRSRQCHNVRRCIGMVEGAYERTFFKA